VKTRRPIAPVFVNNNIIGLDFPCQDDGFSFPCIKLVQQERSIWFSDDGANFNPRLVDFRITMCTARSDKADQPFVLSAPGKTFFSTASFPKAAIELAYLPGSSVPRLMISI
jgi:hypothetical protein